MKETALRWKGRVGSLKILGALGVAGACIILLVGVSGLNLDPKNTGEPQPVTITQLVSGEIGSGTYVSVSGIAEHDLSYDETEDNKLARPLYFLLDPDAGRVVLVEHHAPVTVDLRSGERVTITGMTTFPASGLQEALERDREAYRERGLETSTKLYVKDGATPPPASVGMLVLCIAVPALLVSAVPFFLPSTVFAPYPVDMSAGPPPARPEVKATGCFVQLVQLEPAIKVGERTRRFTNEAANVIPLAENRLMIYIHHVARTSYKGFTTRTTETDWGVFIGSNTVRAAEPGKVYGWKDRWAVRFWYPGPNDKEETLLAIFESAAAQTQFVNLLRKSGFALAAADATK